jgi:hypothetical protein
MTVNRKREQQLLKSSESRIHSGDILVTANPGETPAPNQALHRSGTDLHRAWNTKACGYSRKPRAPEAPRQGCSLAIQPLRLQNRKCSKGPGLHLECGLACLFLSGSMT